MGRGRADSPTWSTFRQQGHRERCSWCRPGWQRMAAVRIRRGTSRHVPGSKSRLSAPHRANLYAPFPSTRTGTGGSYRTTRQSIFKPFRDKRPTDSMQYCTSIGAFFRVSGAFPLVSERLVLACLSSLGRYSGVRAEETQALRRQVPRRQVSYGHGGPAKRRRPPPPPTCTNEVPFASAL